MFINDLSPMPSLTLNCGTKVIAIGWLDCLHEFTRGTTPKSFRDRLRQLCLNPVRRTRGFHLCPFCKRDDVRGNGEIHVVSADGVVYVAPSLIWHYVAEHEYHPPDRFVEAVMATDVDQSDVGQLSLTILRLADEPTPGNQRDFYETFVKSRVGVRLPGELGVIPSGDYITTGDNRVSIPLARLPDGAPTLLVLADVDKLAKMEAGATFMELDARDVMNMAIQNNTGIIVQAWVPGREAWAGISAEDVVNISRV